MKTLFASVLSLLLAMSLLSACKLNSQEKKKSASPLAPIPSALSTWDGRSDRTDPSWALQSLR